MHHHPGKMVAICLFFAMTLSLSGSVSAMDRHARSIVSATSLRSSAYSLGLELAEALKLKQGIKFYRQATWRSQKSTQTPLTLTSYSERRIEGLGYLRWELKLWHGRWLKARTYARNNPWAKLLYRTYGYRQCLISHESKTSGLYGAENGGTRYVEGGGHSNASGAYQFIDPTWQTRFTAAKVYFGGRLEGSWTHAADAPPKVQDIVAAYAVAADDGVDWTWSDCRAKGLTNAV